jgi:hypothetical protein
MLADTLLSRHYLSPRLDVRHTILLASYIMAMVKESIDGCGGETDIICLTRGSSGHISLSRTEAATLERAWRDYACSVEPALLRSAMSARPAQQSGTVGRTKRTLGHLLDKIMTRRAEIEAGITPGDKAAVKRERQRQRSLRAAK